MIGRELLETVLGTFAGERGDPGAAGQCFTPVSDWLYSTYPIDGAAISASQQLILGKASAHVT